MRVHIKQLKFIQINKGFIKKASLALLTVVVLMFSACGKRTPPLPPIERVPQRVEITGFQQGNIINLIWTMPPRNASESSTLNINRVEIYRLAEPLNSGLSLTEEEFASRSTLINSFPLSDTDFARKQINYKDTLEFAGQAVRLRYALRFVNASGQRAGFSNFLLIEPTARIAASPSLLQVSVSEDAVLLDWIPPESNVDNSRPANILGYNIYRKSGENVDYRLLNNQPITKNQFSDAFFDFGNRYSYLVRTVSLGSNGEPIESLDSNTVSVIPEDKFPPTPPTAITIAAAPNNLSIFFAVNPEKDIAGYRIYRSTDSNLPKANWQLLTRELLTSNTFQDQTVESGKIYFYYLIAVDRTGNISAPSEVVSETAP
jgi:hypothetical protein